MNMVSSLTQTTQDGTGAPSTWVMSYGLGPARRVQTITTKVDGTETKRLRYRFVTEGDSPAVVETSTDQGASWTSTRYVSVPEVCMAASVTGGVGSLQVANLHGDVVSSVPGATGSVLLDFWTETDEYGNQTEPLAAGVSPARYGYLGSHPRATDTPGGGLTLMGARLYNPVTGAFLSIDSVPGGNATPYTYPQNPSSEVDTTGKYFYEMNYNKCASLGCLWMRRLCSSTNQYCSFQWGYRFSNPLRLATAVNMFVSFYVSGHRVGTYKKTTQNGRYWFHGSWLSNNKAFKYGGFMGIGGSVGHLRPWSKIELIFQGSVYGVPGMPYGYFTGRGLWNPKNP